MQQADFGAGKKKLSIYVTGLILCAILTIIPFAVVMQNTLPKWIILSVMFIAACIQLFVQVICFLRLNTETEQGKINVMSFIFTGLILLVIVLGSLWIMWNVNVRMMM